MRSLFNELYHTRFCLLFVLLSLVATQNTATHCTMLHKALQHTAPCCNTYVIVVFVARVPLHPATDCCTTPCNALQQIATCTSFSSFLLVCRLRHTAIQHTATPFTILQHSATHTVRLFCQRAVCSTLQHNKLQNTTLQHTAAPYSSFSCLSLTCPLQTLQRNATPGTTTQNTATRCT